MHKLNVLRPHLAAALFATLGASSSLAEVSGDWMVAFKVAKDAAAECRFRESLLDVNGPSATITIPYLDADTLLGRGDVESPEGPQTKIQFKMIGGENVVLDGTFGARTATGSWTAASPACQGTWTATRRD